MWTMKIISAQAKDQLYVDEYAFEVLNSSID